jgi:hypothetical protein
VVGHHAGKNMSVIILFANAQALAASSDRVAVS